MSGVCQHSCRLREVLAVVECPVLVGSMVERALMSVGEHCLAYQDCGSLALVTLRRQRFGDNYHCRLVIRMMIEFRVQLFGGGGLSLL